MSDESNSNQQRILDAAKQLFLTKGYNGSNLRDIASEARVSMGGIYHHFASKEEIYTSLLASTQVAGDMLRVLELIRADAFPHNLAEVGRAIAGTVREHTDSFKLFYIDVLEFQGRNVQPLIAQFHEAINELGNALLGGREDELTAVHPGLLLRVMLNVFIHLRLEEAMLGESLAAAAGLDDAAVDEQIARLVLEGVLKR